jgi:hypothetical protein
MTYSYITKPTQITASQIRENSFSLSIQDYYFVLQGKKTQPIQNLITDEFVGDQINVQEYLSYKTGFYLGTISSMDSLLLNSEIGENISPIIFSKSLKKLTQNSWLISRNASLGKLSYVNKDTQMILNGGISSLTFRKEVNFYVPAFFISNYAKIILEKMTSGGGTQQNAKRGDVLNIPIPFPTTDNHENPDLVQEYVSLLVQNIIDKEEQIEVKNKKIDQLIEGELNQNQKNNQFTYKMPTRSEVVDEERFDAGFYDGEGAKLEQKILQYQNGYYKINKENIRTGNTPKDYIYATEYKSGFYSWITPKNINGRTLSEITYLRSNKKSPVSKYSIILTGVRYVGNGIICNGELAMYSNQNTLIVKQFSDLMNQVFLLCFLTSDIGRALQMRRRITGIVPILYLDDLAKIPIPSFPEPKQQEIAREYYNEINVISEFNLTNYLELHKQRNRQLGIYHLNMELFELREELEKLVYHIVMGLEIKINCKIN